MPSPRSLDYEELARLLEQAATEHRQLGAVITDPVASYQLQRSVDFFMAARNAARDYTRCAERLDTDPGCPEGPSQSTRARRVNVK